MLNQRQFQVGIHRRIAMPREVFPASGDAVFLKTSDDRRAQLRYRRGILTERTVADDWILWIGVDIEDRRVVEGDSDGPQFRRERRREPVRELYVTAASERRHRRPLRERRLEPRDAAALLIHSNPEWKVGGQLLQILIEFRDLLVREAAHLAHGAARSILGRSCEDIQINLTQAIDIWPGSFSQVPHRDQDIWLGARHPGELMLNAMWAIDDFTV
jgi:hypothetical protein